MYRSHSHCPRGHYPRGLRNTLAFMRQRTNDGLAGRLSRWGKNQPGWAKFSIWGWTTWTRSFSYTRSRSLHLAKVVCLPVMCNSFFDLVSYSFYFVAPNMKSPPPPGFSVSRLYKRGWMQSWVESIVGITGVISCRGGFASEHGYIIRICIIK